ncbi:hypothetical protein [Bradyrhizobium viridifuturi]|uniref:hypothetical protein n=1 Tax=Bradyrhizobium viridifuturi TaxID=1654716 RepID=UPI000B219763|nr:hypothetical protein [Bradyrhizobium viridifuturi]
MRVAIEALAPFAGRDRQRLSLAIFTGFACAVSIAKTLPLAMSVTSAFPAPLCAEISSFTSALNKVEVISSYALPDVPGKRVTVVPRQPWAGRSSRARMIGKIIG